MFSVVYLFFFCVFLALLTACGPVLSLADTPTSSSNTLALEAKTRTLPVALARYALAWDGVGLWQVDQAHNVPRMSRQLPGEDTIQTFPVRDETFPVHEHMAYGQERLWLLTRDNKLQELHINGELGKVFTFSNEPVYGSLEAVSCYEDELWLLNKSYLAGNGEQHPAEFWQIDPQSGEILKKLSVEDEQFTSFAHLNLASDAAYFYTVRTSVFIKEENQLFRISKTNGEVESLAIGQIITGMPTLFFSGKDLLGVELLEVENCGALCQGRIFVLPAFENE